MLVIDNKTREHAITNTNRDRFHIVGSPSHEFIVIAFYDERAGLETVHWPSSESPFRWRVDEGPILCAFGSSLPSSLKHTQSLIPFCKTFWIRA